MLFTDELYNYTEDLWEAYFDHPFVKGIEDGSLDKEKFKFYMLQDYIYLWDYSKLFALGALKTEDKELIASFAKSMDLTINYEMNIHRSYMNNLGISREEQESEKISFINLSYTNYMLSVSQKGGYEEVVAALLSCAWTYAEIAKNIDRNNSKAKDHEFYGAWVQGYISDEFQDTAKFYIDQMNKLAEPMSPERKSELAEIFRNCCIYELKFWDMAYNKSYDFGAI